MPGHDPRSVLDKLVGVCLSLLVAAVAISVAVHLIEAVWAALLVILSVALFISLVVVVLRTRNRGW